MDNETLFGREQLKRSAETRVSELGAVLEDYHRRERALPGIQSQARRESFVLQLLDSSRRTEYVSRMLGRNLADLRRDPAQPMFDPILGAIVCSRGGEYEEACWLTLLATQFGKAAASGWELCRAVYGRLGSEVVSSWERTSSNPRELCEWIVGNADEIKRGPPPRRFGNHRKYESLLDKGARGTPATLRTYVAWVMAAGSHAALIDAAVVAADGDRFRAFDDLYRSMSAVSSFGRLARFDYLSMLGKLQLAPIAAGSTYVSTSTGPLAGAALLFFDASTATHSAAAIDLWLRDLGQRLGVTMQDLEDALCNWQKSPDSYRRFSG